MLGDRINPSQALLPLALLSFVVVLFLCFQTTLLISDRSSLHTAREQQDKPIEQIQKIKAQVNALAVGTLKLSEQGNKDAQNIIAALKKSGINVSDQVTPPPSDGDAAPSTPPEQ